MTLTSVVGKKLKNGKYIINQELGEGGFGCTYKATNQILNQMVVIKTLKSDSVTHINPSDVRAEFLNEAQRLIQCYHPNIVRFYEFFSEKEVPYIVMEYIPGKTLDHIVLPDNPLSEATAIQYIRQVGEALKVVHYNHLLHRDVKPQNLILRQDTQQVVLIDFGIAREVSWGAIQTQTNFVSDGYAPIEQYLPRAKRTPATDVYGLAATLYTLVTAQIPVAATLRSRLPLENPQKIRPELSNAISKAIMKGMALELEERPSSVYEWLALLPQADEMNSQLIKLDFTTNQVSAVATQKKDQAYLNVIEVDDCVDTKISSNRTTHKLANTAIISSFKFLGYSKQVWAGFIAFVGLVLGLDYAWLRFQYFSENEKINLSRSKESEQIIPIKDNLSDSKRIPEIFVSPNQLDKQITSTVVSPEKSESITPLKENLPNSRRMPDIFLVPNQLDTPTEPQESDLPTTNLVIPPNNYQDQEEKQNINTMMTMMTIKLVYLKAWIIVGLLKKYIGSKH